MHTHRNLRSQTMPCHAMLGLEAFLCQLDNN